MSKKRKLSDKEAACRLLMYAVGPVMSDCSNSYANSCVSSWLKTAKRLGAYHGPVVGNIRELSAAWDQWVEGNCPGGMLPPWDGEDEGEDDGPGLGWQEEGDW